MNEKAPEPESTSSGASNVEGFPSTHIDAYRESAEILKVELWNLLVEHIADDFPPEWAIGCAQSVLRDVSEEFEL